ncbi:MAG: metal-dependent hydrolase [Vicinamibacterales bacterium]
MDPLCHTLAGAAIGHAGLARRSARGMGTLLIAANLPDVDVAVFATDGLAMAVRRGWTHGILAQALAPPLLAGAVIAWHRAVGRRSATTSDPPRFGPLTLLSYAGVLSHVFLDFLNSYGVRLLMPFSDRWFYGDALYIVDPWMYLALGSGVVLAYGRRRDGRPRPERSAQIGLAIASVYVALMLVSNALARSVVADGLVRAGLPATTRFMVTPVLVNPFRREVVIDLGDRYEKGFVWFQPAAHFRPAGYGVATNLDDPAVQEALRVPRARRYLQWSRFPFAIAEASRSPRRIWLNDYRYSSVAPSGWSASRIDVSSP